jgi:hypothetical protein
LSVTATGGVSYSWSDGSTVVGTNALLLITAPGTYTVTVTGDNGCTATASISITQDETLPTAGITNNTGTTELTCTLTSISVTATGGVSYSWSDGSTVVGTNASLLITAPGTYTVTVTGDNGCTATASISITQDETLPTAGITNNTGTTELTCTLTSISVTATGGGTYSWSDGSTVVGTNALLLITAPGTYTVTVTGDNGCTATASIIITQDESIPSFTCPESQTLALNENCRIIVPNLIADLSGSDDCGAYTFTQNPTAGTQITLNDGETSTVVITASNSSGKTTSCDVVLTAEDATSPSFTCPQAQDVNLNASCELIVPDLITTLTGSDNCGTVTFTQSPMAGTALPSGHNQTHDVIITANDGNGNTSTCTVTLTGKDVTPPVITTCPTVVTIENKPGRCYAEFNLSSPSSLFGDLAFEDNCSGAYVGSILTMWNWQDPFNPLINRFNVGDHNITVTVKDKAGNTASCTYIIRIIDSENPTALCKPATVTLDADGNGTLAVSDINNGSKDNCGIQSLLLSQTSFSCNDIGTNNVTLTITDNSGNVAECTAVVTVVDGSAPTADITNNSGTTVLTCATTSISVTATGGVSYSWDGGTSLNTAENSFNVPGIYTVTVTTANGCISTASITITKDETVPEAPPTECWETATWNQATCSWDITGTQPEKPVAVNCWDDFVFDSDIASPDYCTWVNVGKQQDKPVAVNCWDDFVFDSDIASPDYCTWVNVGKQQDKPVAVNCWDDFVFDSDIASPDYCTWVNVGKQQDKPVAVNCWDDFVFDSDIASPDYCTWVNVGKQQDKPVAVNCWDDFVFDSDIASPDYCTWVNVGKQQDKPVAVNCWDDFVFDSDITSPDYCTWVNVGKQQDKPVAVNCWDDFVFDSDIASPDYCTWVNVGKQQDKPVAVTCFSRLLHMGKCWQTTG